MCGITGFIDFSRRRGNSELRDIAQRMAGALIHRGPDDRGEWSDSACGIAMAHRRLSILDLSSDGRQPMSSACGRFVVCFNGEIYNYVDLRNRLLAKGRTFKGQSDTEVIVNALAEWGLRETLERIIGMFALAIWDREKRILTLARDRMGEKPLYYGRVRDGFVFGSELRALRAHPGWDAALNSVERNSITLLLRYNCIPAPYTIYSDTYKLLPGHFVSLDPEKPADDITPAPYWSLNDAIASAKPAGSRSSAEITGSLETLLKKVIRQQMASDVPLGAFLSGGVDSSTVVALMQAQSASRIKTFTIGFHEDSHNEAVYAEKVAKHLGTDHTELYLTARDALDVVPSLPSLYDEPFSDSSQVPTFLLARLAKSKVTVSLSGDGGDEVFAGYNRYLYGKSAWEVLRRIPLPLRKLAAAVSRPIPPKTYALAGRALRARQPLEKIRKLLELVDSSSSAELYLRLVSHWNRPETVVLNSSEPDSLPARPGRWPVFEDPVLAFQYLDSVTYLPDDILTKVDRACMATSLESRIPFLDQRVVEFAWGIPLAERIKNGEGKWHLRRILEKYVPKSLTDRPKAGFAVPIDAWLRGPLRPWAEAQLGEDRLKREGFFDSRLVRSRFEEHLSGRRNWQYHLWDVLMFQSWFEAQDRNRSGSESRK